MIHQRTHFVAAVFLSQVPRPPGRDGWYWSCVRKSVFGIWDALPLALKREGAARARGRFLVARTEEQRQKTEQAATHQRESQAGVIAQHAVMRQNRAHKRTTGASSAAHALHERSNIVQSVTDTVRLCVCVCVCVCV
jgi:hypothetical protein